MTAVSGPDVSGAVWLSLQDSSIVLAAYIYCRAGPVKCSLVSNLECVLSRKLAPKFIGPFTITKVINPVAYHL